MTQDFSWLASRQPTEPALEHLATFWTLRGRSGRDLTCAAYRTDTGLELRAAYSNGDIVRTELYRGVDADDQLATRADAWRLTLIAKGFREIAR